MTSHANRAFSEFVKRQQSLSAASNVSANENIDWAKRRDNWLSSLKTLYNDIENFLSEYTSAGSIIYEYKDVCLNEEYIGDYSANEMIIQIGP